MKKVAVFISGGGSNLQSLIDYEGKYEISLVISDKEEAYGLVRAQLYDIPSLYIGKKNTYDHEERTQKIIQALKNHEIQVVVLAGYLSIMPKEITDLYPRNMINIHPSLIPSFCGMGYYGEKVHQGVYDSGVKITGATVHFVDAGVDTGPIICQEAVYLEEGDTPDLIGKKVLTLEHRMLPRALEQVCCSRVSVKDGRTIIFQG